MTIAPPVGAFDADSLRWPNRFASLGPRFYTELVTQPIGNARWVATSASAAALLGWPHVWWRDAAALPAFSGAAAWPGMQPLASVYSGHQFGVWAGQLGDGRAHLLGEVATPSGGIELQLKGSGRTPYSRMGDGRAVLRSSIREFLGSEAMHALGIPTTRALCVVASDLPVRREEIETAAVVTRMAESFIRFGHFEHFCHHGLHDELRVLADFVIEHHYPACRDAAQPHAALLEAVVDRTAVLMAQWQAVGFCHGVMNTDNMSILGLTIDYGPFGFMDGFDPRHICNHSDDHGRYAYGSQPDVGLWNLKALAQAMLPLLGEEEAAVEQAVAALQRYGPAFTQAIESRMRAKLGLASERGDDKDLINALFALMARHRADFTIVFRRLAQFSSAPGALNAGVRDLFIDREAFDAWGAQYAARLRAEASVDADRAARMNRVNPKYVLRNHLAEIAIRRSREGDDGEVHKLHAILERPFDEQPEHEDYAGFPPEWASQLEVSCSS
jgi:serine/tyrosine/threonine adenylyltransferase